MTYQNFNQGDKINLDGLKYFLRVVDDAHDAEFSALLKSATIYVQEYLNICLAECSVIQECSDSDNVIKIYLNNQTNIICKDYDGNIIEYSRSGNELTIYKAMPVILTYDCSPCGDVEIYANLVYQIVSALYDGQADLIPRILQNYPVC